MAIDHLRAVELVTPEGEILRASERAHPELFWGLRGGGGNFGVATAFEVELHPAGTVLGGAVFYEVVKAERILQGYAGHAHGCAARTVHPASPAWQAHRRHPGVLHGDLAQGERVMSPLRRLATPIADVVGPMPYPVMFALTEVGTIRGLEQHVRSLFLQTLSDEVLHTLTEKTLATMSPETPVQIRVLGGTMGQVSVDATAFAHRATQAMVIVTNFGPPSADAKGRSARTEQVWQALQPYADGVYVNFLAEEGEQWVHEAYPRRHRRNSSRQRTKPVCYCPVVLATGYSCSRMMREKYDLKAYARIS
jgi:hypothetical protein